MTLITNKYDYKEINKKSVDGRRLYACPDGNAVASVTNVYNRNNIFFVDRITATRVDQLPILPSFGLVFSF